MSGSPTHFTELVPQTPAFTGAHDAAVLGMGGLWFGGGGDVPGNQTPPLLWRQRFPLAITQSPVSFAIPQGSITNSDLELAGHVAHNDILASHASIQGSAIESFTDNTPTLYWCKWGSISTKVQAAFLFRLQALHQRYYQYYSALSHIAGTANVTADDCSRPGVLV